MGLFAMAQGFFLNPNPSCSYLTGLVCAGMSGLLRKALQALFDTIDLQLLAHFAPESLWSGRFRVIRQGRCMQRPYASPSAGLRYGRLRGASTLFLFLTFSKCPAVGTLHATSTKQSPKYPACSALFQKCPVVCNHLPFSRLKTAQQARFYSLSKPVSCPVNGEYLHINCPSGSGIGPEHCQNHG